MNKGQVLLAATIAASMASAHAEQGRHDAREYGTFEEQGWGGEISFLAGFGSEKDNQGTNADVYKITSLETEGKSESSAIVGAIGQARYTFDSQRQQAFFGISRDNVVDGVFALELGYAFYVGEDSVISMAVLPTIVKGEAWQDPYLINVDRKKTDVSGNAFRLQYENMFDLGIDADFAFYDRKVDQDLSGSSLTTGQQALLKRDGKGYRFELSTGFPISESTFIMPSVGYHQFSADGDAMSFSRYELGLTAMHRMGKHAVALNFDYAQADYDAVNPIFNKTRDDKSFGVNLSYEYQDFMGWENTGFNVLAGYDKSDSNIDYYDTSGYMLAFGISYLF